MPAARHCWSRCEACHKSQSRPTPSIFCRPSTKGSTSNNTLKPAVVAAARGPPRTWAAFAAGAAALNGAAALKPSKVFRVCSSSGGGTCRQGGAVRRPAPHLAASTGCSRALQSNTGPQPYLLLTADSQPLQLLREGHGHVARCFHRSGLPCRLGRGALTKMEFSSGVNWRCFSLAQPAGVPGSGHGVQRNCPLCAPHGRGLLLFPN